MDAAPRARVMIHGRSDTLDDVDWSGLTHAYGSALDVPTSGPQGLLRQHRLPTDPAQLAEYAAAGRTG